jgi:hypothetical protein
VTGEMVAYFNSMKRQMFFQCPEGFAHITKWLQFLDGGLTLIDKIKLNYLFICWAGLLTVLVSCRLRLVFKLFRAVGLNRLEMKHFQSN